MKKSIVLFSAILICLSFLTGCGSKPVTIDLSDYLDALYRGSDGSGTARGDFDCLGFEDTVLAGTGSDQFNLSEIIQFESSMVIAVTPDKDLKNGDTVTVTAAYDKNAAKAAGIIITGNTKTFTVESLNSTDAALTDSVQNKSAELDAFDPNFWDKADGIVLSYSGISPYGNLEICNNLPSENPLSRVGYSFSESQNLHEGDSVTVSAYFKDADMKNDYFLKEMSGIYTVGPVDHYLTNIDELDSGTVASMKRSAQDLTETSISGCLEFQTAADCKGFYNGETISINSNEAGSNAYTLRNGDGFIEVLAIPCYVNVTVRDPDWMENAGESDYDLVFLITVSNIVVHADGTITANDPELNRKGTSDIESELMNDLKTWYTNPAVDSVPFAG